MVGLFYAYYLYYICKSLFLNLFGSLRYCLGFLLLIHSFSLLLYSDQSKKEVRNRHKKLEDILQATCRQVIWLS